MILQSDNRWHTGTFCTKFHIAFILWISNSSLRNHSFSCSLGPLRTFSLNIFGNAPFTTFFITHKVLTMSLVSSTYSVWVRAILKLLVSSPAKRCSIFRSFLTRKIEKVGVFLELFLYTEMAQYLNFICFDFKISAFVMSLFPWASSRCSEIVTRLSRTNNSKLGYSAVSRIIIEVSVRVISLGFGW